MVPHVAEFGCIVAGGLAVAFLATQKSIHKSINPSSNSACANAMISKKQEDSDSTVTSTENELEMDLTTIDEKGNADQLRNAAATAQKVKTVGNKINGRSITQVNLNSKASKTIGVSLDNHIRQSVPTVRMNEKRDLNMLPKTNAEELAAEEAFGMETTKLDYSFLDEQFISLNLKK